MVEVILRQAVDELGDIGEVVDVKPGYARNYLIPRGMAYEATDANQKRFEEERRHIFAKSTRELDRAKANMLTSYKSSFDERDKSASRSAA